MIRRDYIERLVAQAAQALAQVLELVRAGQFDPALQLIRRTSEAVLGPLWPLVDRLDPESAVQLAGRWELDRIRLYAALLGEETLVHNLRERPLEAARCGRRALELYAASALGGAQLLPADRERIALLLPLAGDIDPRYQAEAARLAAPATN